MKKSILITLTILLVSIGAIAQADSDSTKIRLSTDKVKIEGKYYFIHIVRKGETLYSISRAYGVSQIEIATENPDIYLGIKIDQALKIPIKDLSLTDIQTDEKFIYHVVKRKETLFGLTRKYGVSIEDIITANPEVEQGLKTNQVVLIPKQPLATSPTQEVEEQKPDRFIYHEVRPREGFFAITRKYNVTEETIRRFNEDLVADGIKLGTVLRIPRDPTDTIPEMDMHTATSVAVHQSSPTTAYETPMVICDTFQYNRWRDVYNISLLLPFTIENKEQLTDDAEDDKDRVREEKKLEVSRHSANFLDFYQGFLLAVKNLQKEGLSIKLNVFNTEKSVSVVEGLIHSGQLENSNLLIGPAYTECQAPVVRFSAENRIPLISPFSSNSYSISQNPFYFQANPSFLTQIEEFAQQLNLCQEANIVIIHETDTTSQAMTTTFKQLINQRIAGCVQSENTHFKEFAYKAGSVASEMQELISHSLSLEKQNIIIVPSNNEAFVCDLLGNLQALSTIYKYPIEVFGFPRWQNFKNLQVDYLYELSVKFFTPFYVDYSSLYVKEFVIDYRDAYRAEPGQYAFQGYDIALYFLTAMKQYGPDFMYCINNLKPQLLQSEFNFVKKTPTSGFENNAVRIIGYSKDFEIGVVSPKPLGAEPTPQVYIEEQPLNRKEAIYRD